MEETIRILVVDDEPDIRRICRILLENSGYTVLEAATGLEAVETIRRCPEIDLILMDIMMPDLDGYDACSRLRACSTAPVLFLTARDSVADKVEGLESGGDYYLTKPFDFQELIAVVHVMTRKYTGNRSNIYTIADLTLDVSARTVTRAGRSIELTQKEFALLEYMVRNRGVVLSREMIENNLWNYDYEGGTNVVDVYVGYLRKKMDAGFDKKLIHTVWGTGWVLRED